MIKILNFDFFESAAEREARGCTGKLKHRDAEAAEKARLSMQKKTGMPFDRYECEFCGSHHIGHSRRHFEIPEEER
jgi:hypothetical protein